jgi:SLOG cluster2
VNSAKKYRSRVMEQSVIAFSVSYQHDNLLSRGLGLEHIRELLIRLARPILRRGASLAYSGHWKETEDNFTYDLLRLISAEQEDNSLGGPDTNVQIGILYNHAPWPHYLDISRKIEAQWINACRIVRVTQKDAGFTDSEIAAADEVQSKTDRAIFNAAVTLSAMRRLMMTQWSVSISDVPTPEIIPPVTARILLGGRVDGFSGFLPGIFEEALVTLEQEKWPVYILGGFGGAAEVLAGAILTGSGRPQELTTKWLADHNPALAKLNAISGGFKVPDGVLTTDESLDRLVNVLSRAHSNPADVLCTGLSDEETRELLTTRNVATAVSLVRKGLIQMGNLPA